MKEQKIQGQIDITKQQVRFMIDQIIKKRYSKGCQRLNLYGCEMKWLPILKGRNWEHIKDLNLQNCNLNTACLQKFKKQKLASLQKLNIGQSKIENEGLRILLIDLPMSLKQLWMWDCRITSLEGLDKIDFSNLTQLRLKRNQIGSEGAKILASCNFLSLKGLGLKQCLIGEKGAKYLSKALFPSLQAIDMRNCHIGINGTIQIFRSPWKNIKQLGLDERGIGILGLLNVLKTEWKILNDVSLYVEYQMRYFKPYEREIRKKFKDILKQKFK